MAIVTNTFTTFDAKGIREDLSNVITNIAPEETPYMSNIGRESVSNSLYEWQTDTLASAAANKQLEGDDVTSFDSVTATVRMQNYAQISRKTIVLSATEETVNKQRVSGFSGIASSRFNIDGGAKPATLVGAVDIYVSDFGNVQVIANRFQRERDAWVIDPDYAKLMTLRPYQQVELAKTGDAEKRMLIVEWGLKVTAENAHGIAADLITS